MGLHDISLKRVLRGVLCNLTVHLRRLLDLYFESVLQVTLRMSRTVAARAATSILLGALCASPTHARVYTGSFSGASNPFVAKFAFGVDPSGGTVGNINVQYSNLPPSETGLSLYEFDDDQWDAVYPGKVTCQQSLGMAAQSLPMPNTGSSITGSFTETQRPHFWFFTMSNAGCQTGVYVDWTVTLTQAE